MPAPAAPSAAPAGLLSASSRSRAQRSQAENAGGGQLAAKTFCRLQERAIADGVDRAQEDPRQDWRRARGLRSCVFNPPFGTNKHMHLIIESKLDYTLAEDLTTILLQIEAAALPEQRIVDASTTFTNETEISRVPAEDGVGERSWIRSSGKFLCTYRATVELDRPEIDLSTLSATPLHELPGDVVKYLLPSRYCQPEQFSKIVTDEFGGLAGGAMVLAMRDWIEDHLDYVRGSSDETTTAKDTFLEREGICRDYSHVMINLARAACIPARFVSVYAPSVEPPDFHAVTEVYLDGAWHLVDATGMANPGNMVKIGVGRDAIDVAFMSVYGQSELNEQSVSVTSA
jgi:transglutaminase-like putative cysteine protease